MTSQDMDMLLFSILERLFTENNPDKEISDNALIEITLKHINE